VKQITDEYIAREWNAMCDALEEQHGSPFSVPTDERNIASERLRALHVLQEWQRENQSANLVSFMNSYSITGDAQEWIIENHARAVAIDKEKVASVGKTSRKKKWATFTKAVREQRGKEFTTDELVTLSGFSYPATLAFIKKEPLFISVKKGLWRIASSG
jgi:kynurenine formamidase